MKLRNKKTGRVVNFRHIAFDEPKDDRENYRYSSLAEFNEEWEDYKPKEPLIKDEKRRKAVRAWAEANSIKKVIYAERTDRSLCNITDMGDYDFSIEFVGWISTLKDSEVYTIAELCGEEKE